jgi:hypothetical protein
MKRILILMIVPAIFSCKSLDTNSLGTAEENLIPGSYIITLDDEEFVPIFKEFDKNEFLKDPEKQIQIKKSRIEEIQEFALKYNITLSPEDVFVYTSSGFYVDSLKEKTAKKLLKKKKKVSDVQQDFTIQDIRARMQHVGPLPQHIRARMQEELRHVYDTVLFSSKSIIYVGGGQNQIETDRKIWIVDSGIDSTHQDLRGQVDSVLSRSWVKFRPEEMYPLEEKNPFIDFIGHGTHCAGAAAGRAYNQGQPNNERLIGMNGVSPGAKLVSLKVFANDRTAKWNWIKFALEYVGEKSTRNDVVSLSLGGFGRNSITDKIEDQLEILDSLGIFVVMAAGNGKEGVGVHVRDFFPASVDGLNRVLTIGSFRLDSQYPENPPSFSVFSNFGHELDYVAPGELVFSTFPGNRYAVSSGTSVATAIVAGIIHANNGLPAERTEKVLGPPGTKPYTIPRRTY